MWVRSDLDNRLSLLKRFFKLKGALSVCKFEWILQIFCSEHVWRINVKRLLFRLLLFPAQECRQVPPRQVLRFRLILLGPPAEEGCNCFWNHSLLFRHLLCLRVCDWRRSLLVQDGLFLYYSWRLRFVAALAKHWFGSGSGLATLWLRIYFSYWF